MNRFNVAILTAVLTASYISGVAAQKVRTLPPDNKPIESRLLPDDEVVVVQPLMASRRSTFEWTRESELSDLATWEEVAVIHQAKSESFFVRNGTWLDTRVTARVMQTLKTGRLATAPGRPITFEHGGGELSVRAVTVRSAEGVSFEPSKRYLVAIRYHDGLQKWQVGVMFELDNLGFLREHRRRSGSTVQSALTGLRLAEVADAISKRPK